MIAVAYANPTISRLATPDGMLHIGGLRVGWLAEPVGAELCRFLVGVDRRPPGLYD